MNSIVIATDGSSGSAHALEQGFELASALSADVSVVYVRHAPHAFLGSPYYQNVLTEERTHASGVITDAKLHAIRYDVDPEYEVLEGDPVDSILAVADSRDADLIVVGSRGLGRVAGTVLGTVSKEIIRRAERPVMLAKERAHVAAR